MFGCYWNFKLLNFSFHFFITGFRNIVLKYINLDSNDFTWIPYLLEELVDSSGFSMFRIVSFMSNNGVIFFPFQSLCHFKKLIVWLPCPRPPVHCSLNVATVSILAGLTHSLRENTFNNSPLFMFVVHLLYILFNQIRKFPSVSHWSWLGAEFFKCFSASLEIIT